MLYQQIKDDLLAARKLSPANNIVKSLLVTLVSDLSMIEKNTGKVPTQPEIYAVIKKYIDNNAAFQKANPDPVTLDALKVEELVLRGYMPQQLSPDEMDKILSGFLISNPGANIGQIMGLFKTCYPGRYDAQILSTKAKAALMK